MRFDKNSLKDFFINHTEKIIFGFFVLGFLFMVWGGFSLKPLSITAKDLDESVKRGRQKLESSEPDVSQYSYTDFETEADISSKSISPQTLSLLELKQDFRHPIAQPQVKRTQPPVLTLKSLHVSSGAGFSRDVHNDTSTRSGQAGKNQIKLNPGVRWVVVTALVPNQEQTKKFFETFQGADVKYPETDKPSYYSYYVEREEITNDGPQGWKPLDLKEALIINKRYSNGSGTEVVEPEFIAPSPTLATSGRESEPTSADSLKVIPASMAMQLMNLSKHQWGADCAHLPEIPTMSLTTRNEEDASLDDELGISPTRNDTPSDRDSNKIVPYKLFRFFDTKVEGGKKYRYRFKLVLKNPNYNVKAEYVESESMTQNPFLEGAWSEASPIAEVPLDTRLYCVGSRVDRSQLSQTTRKPANDGSIKLEDFTGPTGRLMILKFDEVKGLEISKRLGGDSILPGMVLNFYRTEFDNLSDDMFSRDQSGSANFVTNNVVLDFACKTKLPLGFKAGLPMPPANALLMTKDGKIIVLSEVADKPAVYLKSNKPNLSSSGMNTGRGYGREDDGFSNRPSPKRNSKPSAGGDRGGIFE